MSACHFSCDSPLSAVVPLLTSLADGSAGNVTPAPRSAPCCRGHTAVTYSDSPVCPGRVGRSPSVSSRRQTGDFLTRAVPQLRELVRQELDDQREPRVRDHRATESLWIARHERTTGASDDVRITR